jgi:hypothetical protein
MPSLLPRRCASGEAGSACPHRRLRAELSTSEACDVTFMPRWDWPDAAVVRDGLKSSPSFSALGQPMVERERRNT